MLPRPCKRDSIRSVFRTVTGYWKAMQNTGTQPALGDTLAGTFGADNMGQSLARMDGEGERLAVDLACVAGRRAPMVGTQKSCSVGVVVTPAGMVYRV